MHVLVYVQDTYTRAEHHTRISQYTPIHSSTFQYIQVYSSILQYTPVYSSTFQYIPVYSSDLPVGSLRVTAERKERERPSLPVMD